MSSVGEQSASEAGSPPVKPGEMRLEVVVVPVSDVDRAKRFYEGSLGWRLDADLAVDDGYRVVQLTPPGSGCSIIFGDGRHVGPARLVRGPAALGVRHRRGPCRPGRARGRRQRAVPRRDRDLPSRRDRGPRGRPGAGACGLRLVRSPSAIRTATAGCCRRSRPGSRAAEGSGRWPRTYESVEDLADALRRAAEAHGKHEERTGEADAGLAGLVRALHGARARRRGAADMNSDYDVIVIGGGSPGEHCAGALAEGGLRVAVVERELVGGECSYWACIPSKTLLRPGEAVHGAREAAATAEVDVEAALAWRDFMVSDYSDAGQERWLARTASICCAAAAGSPARASSRSTACATPPTTWSSPTAPIRSSRRCRACASSRASGPTARRPR